MDERIDGYATARPALQELHLIRTRVRRADPARLDDLEADAGVSLDAVEMDPLASDDAVRTVRQEFHEIVAAIARRKEGAK